MSDQFAGLIDQMKSSVQDRLNALGAEIQDQLDGLKASPQPVAGGGGDLNALAEAALDFHNAYTQVEVLNRLVVASSAFVPRVLLLIRKGANVHGWLGRGFDPAFESGSLKKVRWSINDYPELTRVIHQKKPLIANFSDLSDISEQINTFDDYMPFKSCFFPLTVKTKVAAILYTDSGSEPQLSNMKVVELLNYVAGVELTLITSKIKVKDAVPDKPAATPAPATAPSKPAPAAAPQPVPREAAPASQPTPAPAPAAKPPAAEENPAVKKARRVARVLVSDLKLYNEDAVNTGRRNGNLYAALKDDLDRSYKHYQERVSGLLPNNEVNYFKEELIKQLADGNPDALGKIPF